MLDNSYIKSCLIYYYKMITSQLRHHTSGSFKYMGSIPVILCILNLITQLILYIGPGLSRMNRGKAEDKVG